MTDANKVAIVGIAATALVGLGGITASWYTARETRGAQENIAETALRAQLKIADQARVHANQSTIYLEALRLMSDVRKKAAKRGVVFDRSVFRPFVLQDEALDTRMYVYGTHAPDGGAYKMWSDLSRELVHLQNDDHVQLNRRQFDKNYASLEEQVKKELG